VLNLWFANIAKFLFVLLLLSLGASSNLSSHPWGGLVIDEQGNIYFTFICPVNDDQNHYACIWKLDTQNNLVEVLKAQFSPSDLILNRNQYRDIYAAERTGQHPDYSNTLWKIESSNSNALISNERNQANFHIQTFAVVNNKDIYFSKGNKIYQRNSENRVDEILEDFSFERINLMTVAPDGKLYFMAGDDIYFYKDSKIEHIISDLKIDNPEALPFSGANIFFDMAIDNNENIYLAYYGNRQIIKINPSGKKEIILTSEEPWSPHGIDVFNGEVYVLESTIGSGKWWKFWEEDVGIVPRIRKISTDGKISTLYTFKN
jgi:hypothetical protein